MTNNWIADTIRDQTEEIVRRWVAALRQTSDTEVHNEMLTAEIVSSTKAVLTLVASAVETDTPVEQALREASPGFSRSLTGDPTRSRSMGTRPLISPLARALQTASLTGVLRQQQGYHVDEVVIEYIKLR